MKAISRKLAQFLVPALLLSACSNVALEKDIDRRVSQETEVKTRADLTSETSTILEKSKDIKEEQKVKLSELRNSTRRQIDENWQQSLRLRSVLIKELVSKDYNDTAVDLIKKRLKDLDSKRLFITFDAVDQANKILGRQARMNDDVMYDFIRIEHF